MIYQRYSGWQRVVPNNGWGESQIQWLIIDTSSDQDPPLRQSGMSSAETCYSPSPAVMSSQFQGAFSKYGAFALGSVNRGIGCENRNPRLSRRNVRTYHTQGYSVVCVHFRSQQKANRSCCCCCCCFLASVFSVSRASTALVHSRGEHFICVRVLFVPPIFFSRFRLLEFLLLAP